MIQGAQTDDSMIRGQLSHKATQSQGNLVTRQLSHKATYSQGNTVDGHCGRGAAVC